MLCQYRNIFGKPREDSHKYRIPLIDVAVVDVAATFFVAFIIYILAGHSFGCITLGLFATGILAHRLFGVSTKVDKALFGSPTKCPAAD